MSHLPIEKVKAKIPKKDWIKEFIQRIRGGDVWQHSTFVTYYILLTLFPLIVGIINGIQYFEGSMSSMVWFVERVAPQPLASHVVSDLGIIFEQSNVGIFIVATVSTVWTVSWTMASTLMGLNKAYGVSHRKNIVILRILAFLLTFLFAAIIAIVVLLTQAFIASSFGRWTVFVLTSLLVFSLLYYLLPNVKQTYLDVWPGAVFSTIALVIGFIGYRLFISYLPADSTFFTITGSFMVMLAILQKICLATLAGGAINATLMNKRSEGVVPKNENSKFVRLLKRVGILESTRDSE